MFVQSTSTYNLIYFPYNKDISQLDVTLIPIRTGTEGMAALSAIDNHQQPRSPLPLHPVCTYEAKVPMHGNAPYSTIDPQWHLDNVDTVQIAELPV